MKSRDTHTGHVVQNWRVPLAEPGVMWYPCDALSVARGLTFINISVRVLHRVQLHGMKVNVTCGELHFSDYNWVYFTQISCSGR